MKVLGNSKYRLRILKKAGYFHPFFELKRKDEWITVASYPFKDLKEDWVGPGILIKSSYEGKSFTSLESKADRFILSTEFKDTKNNIWHIEDTIQLMDSYFKITRKWDHRRGAECSITLPFEIYYPFKHIDYWMIPGVMYNGNSMKGTGVHHEFEGASIPYPQGIRFLTEPWFFREETPIPSCTFFRTGDICIALFCEPQKDRLDLLSSCSFQDVKDIKPASYKSTIMVPYREAPLSYRGKNYFAPGITQSLSLEGKWEYQRTFYLAFYEEEPPFAFGGLLDLAWDVFAADEKFPSVDIKQTEELRLGYLLKKHLYEEGKVCGLIQLIDEKGRAIQNYMTSGFCGKNPEFAWILYNKYLELNEEKYRRLSFKIIDFFTSHQLPNGLFLSLYHIDKKEWMPELLKGCHTRTIGEACYHYLKLYEAIKDNNEIRNKLLKFCEKTGNFFLNNQLKNGSFGKRWSVEGELLEDTGTNFCYITWFLIKLYQLTREKKYLETAEKSFSIIQKMVQEEYLYGDTLDAACIDRESGAATMHALNALYEETQKEKYLKACLKVAKFTASWQYTYNVKFSKRSQLEEAKFFSLGGFSCSVEIPIMDSFGGLIGYEFLRLYKFTKEKKWLKRGLSAIINAQQCIASYDGEYGLPFKGAQPEQFNQMDYDYQRGLTKGSTNVLIVWNHVLNLGVLQKIKEEFPEIYNYLKAQRIEKSDRETSQDSYKLYKGKY